MQIQAAGRLQDAVQFNQPRRHHDEIRRHLVAPQQFDIRFKQIADSHRRGLPQIFVSAFAPMPRIVERRDLRFRFAPAFVLK